MVAFLKLFCLFIFLVVRALDMPSASNQESPEHEGSVSSLS